MSTRSLVISRAAFVTALALTLVACGGGDSGSPTSPVSSVDEALKAALAAQGGANAFRQPLSDDFNAIPQDPRNPLTADKVALGKKLFHDVRLSINPKYPDAAGTYACASCHHAAAGFQAGRIQGLGEGGLGFGVAGEGRYANPRYGAAMIDAQPVRSPSALSVAYQENMLWNGQFGAGGVNVGTEVHWTQGTPKATNLLGYSGVETQAIAGMGVHRLGISRDRVERFGYLQEFDRSFPTVSESERYTATTTGLAIAAYERTLLANEAPFQRWLRDDLSAMTDAQKRGATTFFGKAQCAQCHRGPALSTNSFHALGMRDLVGSEIVGSNPTDEAHKGRASFTGEVADMFRFKTTQLYNLRDAHFLGHGGSFTSVGAVIRYKNAAIAENPNVPTAALSPYFRPLGLTEIEVAELTDFIENALHDDALSRYVPAMPTCTPVADAIAMAQLNCK